MENSTPARKRVWVIVIGEPLPSEPGSRPLRMRLLARELATAGHDVLWWTSDFNHFAKRYHPLTADEEDSGEGYRIRYLHGRSYKNNISWARHRNHVELALDFAAQAEAMTPPDVLLCCFPTIELTDAASAYARYHAIPFLIDIRDLWPDELERRIPRLLRPLGRLITGPMRRKVARSMASATALTGVSQRYLDWAIDLAGRSRNARDIMLPIGYPDDPRSMKLRAERTTSRKGGLRILFCGSFNHSVDGETAIAAVRASNMPELELVLCGDGPMMADWRAAAGRDGRIRFTGWVGADAIRTEAARADVGLVAYHADSLVALPNKIFEYISFGLPVLNAIGGEAADLVEKHAIGRNYRAGSAASLLEGIASLASSADERRDLGQRAGALFERSFAASALYARYSAWVEDAIAAPPDSNDVSRNVHDRRTASPAED